MTEVQTKPPRPNKDGFQAEMETLTQTIKTLHEELASIQAKIPAKDSNSTLSKAKNEARTTFDSLLNQKKALQAKKKAMFDEVGSLRTGLKKKGDDIKNSRDKLGYRSVAEIDALVGDYEKQIRSGGLSLPEEKKCVAEISTLKKAKRTLESLNSQPSGIEADKAKLDALKISMDAIEKEIKTLDPLVTVAKEKLNEVEKVLKSSYSSLSGLMDTKKEVATKLAEARDAKNALYQSFKAAQDAWFNWERDEKKRQFEAERLTRALEREARLVASAERELEEADVAAFTNEVALCDALIKYFKLQSRVHEETAVEAPVQDSAAIENSKPNARATVLVRKEDRDEEDFMALGSKKSKNKKKQQQNGNAPSTTPHAAKPLKMDLELIDQLSQLSIEIPKTTADAAAVIEALLAKKQHFLDTSSAQTQKNKNAALDKIKALRVAAAAAEVAEE